MRFRDGTTGFHEICASHTRRPKQKRQKNLFLFLCIFFSLVELPPSRQPSLSDRYQCHLLLPASDVISPAAILKRCTIQSAFAKPTRLAQRRGEEGKGGGRRLLPPLCRQRALDAETFHARVRNCLLPNGKMGKWENDILQWRMALFEPRKRCQSLAYVLSEGMGLRTRNVVSGSSSLVKRSLSPWLHLDAATCI
ncbi:hypothetical protein F4809DRAFT_373303 [Biscogniauxia mediterranea]|nr:hypothetical protein F4809DRAFT_373303 [Biscogniauxia mediterranea]